MFVCMLQECIMMFFVVRREKEEHVTAKNSKQGKSSKIEHVFAQLRSSTISNFTMHC